MLVEVLVASLLFISVLFASSQTLSASAEKADLALRRQEAQILAHNELEKTLAIQENSWPWLWSGFCVSSHPCHTNYYKGMWWLSSGARDIGDYHLEVWVDNIGGFGLQKKIVNVRASWKKYGGGEVLEQMIITRPQTF